MGTDRPSEDRNGKRGEQERTGPDRLRLGTERTGFPLIWTGPDQTGPDRSGPDRTGPDWTGPDRTGPDRTGPACGLEWNGPVLCRTVAYLDQNGPGLTRPDRTELDRTRPDRTRLAAAWNGRDRFYTERLLIWTATDRIGPDLLQLGTDQPGFMRNGT